MGHPEATGTDGTSSFIGLLGTSSSEGDEINTQYKFYTAFTCTDLRVEVGSLVDTTLTVTLRDDEADTSVAVAVSATGWTEDLTDSASAVADSLMCANAVSLGMHGDNFLLNEVMLTIEHATTTAPIFGAGGQFFIGAERHSSLGSEYAANQYVQQATRIKRATVLSNLRVRTISVSSPNYDVSPVKNGSASTSVTININATGTFEDATGSESYASGDTASIGHDRTTGSYTISQLQIDADIPEMWHSIGLSGATTREYRPFTGLDAVTTADDGYFMRIGSVSAGSLEAYVTTAGSGTRDITLRVGSTNSTNLTINVTGTGYLEDVTGSDSIADAANMTLTYASTGSEMIFSTASIECPWSDPGEEEVVRRIFITST